MIKIANSYEAQYGRGIAVAEVSCSYGNGRSADVLIRNADAASYFPVYQAGESLDFAVAQGFVAGMVAGLFGVDLLTGGSP